jgi:uncharacterized membrane protein YhaH (DUF805 family)
MKIIRDYFSPLGRIGRGSYAWRMAVGTIIWGVAFFSSIQILPLLFPAYISGAPPDLKQIVSAGTVILLYLWLSLAVQRARDIGYSPMFAAGCFLGCFFVLPIVVRYVCFTTFGSDPVCSGDALPKYGMLVVIPLFMILFSQPSNSFQRRQRQTDDAQK